MSFNWKALVGRAANLIGMVGIAAEAVSQIACKADSTGACVDVNHTVLVAASILAAVTKPFWKARSSEDAKPLVQK